MGLFAIQFTQFSKVCLDQWRLNIENQIKTLKTIFIECDDNNDGVLTLDEFWVLMQKM